MEKVEIILRDHYELQDILRAFNAGRKVPDGLISASVYEDGLISLADQNGKDLLAAHVALRFKKEGDE